MDLISPDLISSPILHGPSDSLFTTKRFFFLEGERGAGATVRLLIRSSHDSKTEGEFASYSHRTI